MQFGYVESVLDASGAQVFGFLATGLCLGSSISSVLDLDVTPFANSFRWLYPLVKGALFDLIF